MVSLFTTYCFLVILSLIVSSNFSGGPCFTLSRFYENLISCDHTPYLSSFSQYLFSDYLMISLLTVASSSSQQHCVCTS